MKIKAALFTIVLCFSPHCFSSEKLTIRLGVLAFGTVNWELTTLKNLNLIDKSDFIIEIHPVANPQAGKIALQSGAVDIIVSDWIWVSRLRSTGSDFTFYPYSTTSGALIVPESSKIKTVNDLSGKKLGIAGGELDKNWLLLQALAWQQHQLDLNTAVEKIYAAPPLITQQILNDRVDAIITYWHFAARLETKGYKQIINGQGILKKLGINTEVPTLGYVFKQSWANQHKTIINEFLKSTQQAKNHLCLSDEVWMQIIPLTKADNTNTEKKLREQYCTGRIKHWGQNEQQAATKIYTLLRQLSHNKLTGISENVQPGTFWTLE